MYFVSVIAPMATQGFHWGKLACFGPSGHGFWIYSEKLCNFSWGKQIRSVICLWGHTLPLARSFLRIVCHATQGKFS